MGKNLEVKKQVVAEIVQKFQAAQSVVIVKYSGLTVEQVTGLREQFRANGVDYCVLKNTLVKRALGELNIQGLDEVLNGTSAFAFGITDAVAPARIVHDFITKSKTEVISVKAGLLGSDIMSAGQVYALAEVPSREALLSRLLGCMQNSVSSLVRVLDAIAKRNDEATAKA